MLCRTENFVDYHDGFAKLLRGEKLLGLLEGLADEPMLLFKEKINYKLAGSGMSLTVLCWPSAPFSLAGLANLTQHRRWLCASH